jgi:hypothetical protein
MWGGPNAFVPEVRRSSVAIGVELSAGVRIALPPDDVGAMSKGLNTVGKRWLSYMTREGIDRTYHPLVFHMIGPLPKVAIPPCSPDRGCPNASALPLSPPTPGARQGRESESLFPAPWSNCREIRSVGGIAREPPPGPAISPKVAPGAPHGQGCDDRLRSPRYCFDQPTDYVQRCGRRRARPEQPPLRMPWPSDATATLSIGNMRIGSPAFGASWGHASLPGI